MAPRRIPSVRKTLLIVGEGHTEKAFLNHLKSIYSVREVNVEVINARGKGPDHILKHAIGCQAHSPRDLVGVLLDTDLEWPKELVKRMTKDGFQLMGSIPCIDGLILEIINQPKPNGSQSCKDKLGSILQGASTDKNTYTTILAESVLETARENVEVLNDLINLIQGKLKVRP